MLTLLLIGILALGFNIQQVRSDWTSTETIHIRTDGSVYPDTAPISSIDNITYTLTDNIFGNVPQWTSAIALERDNIVIDGAGYTLQGTYPYYSSTGIELLGRSNITIKNMRIKEFTVGIYLFESSRNSISANDITSNFAGFDFEVSNDNSISENNVADNWDVGIYSFGSWNSISRNNVANNRYGIKLEASGASISSNNITNNECGIAIHFHSSYSSIFGNNIADNGYGIEIFMFSNYNSISDNNITNNGCGISPFENSNYNSISGNNIANNGWGIELWYSSYNSISGNNIADNGCGIFLHWYTPNNIIYHNDFVGNGEQVSKGYLSANVWDDGYPSGGNYWSDHVTVDQYSGVDQTKHGSDGIVDEPYIINDYDRDNYPLVKPFSFHDIGITGIVPSQTLVAQGTMLDINITVLNYGLYTETFSLTAYANATAISQTEVTLASRNSATITFTWDTTSVALGTYTLEAQASTVPRETDTADNTFVDDQVTLVNNDIAVIQVTVEPTSVKVGETVYINVTVANQGSATETFDVTTYYNISRIETKTGISLDAGESITLEFSWNTTGVTGGIYRISAYASPVPNEIDRSDNYFEDGMVTIVTPEYLTHELIETIETWNLPGGTENSLVSKLEEVILLLSKGNDNGAVHKLMDFISQVEAQRDKSLTDEQADYLIAEAQGIIDLIKQQTS